MLKHKTSVWYRLGHDEDLARQDGLEQWLLQVEQRGYVPVGNPKVRLVRDNRLIRPHTRNGTQSTGFRVSVQGDIAPKEEKT